MKLGFLGLGNMGQAMAGTLLRAGHSVAVWNRTEGKTEQLKSLEGARVATSPADAARNADVVLSILADDRAVPLRRTRSGADISDACAHGELW